MFVPTQKQFQTLSDRKIRWGLTLSTGNNNPHNGMMSCQLIHEPTQTVLADGFGREDKDAFEAAFAKLPSANPSSTSSGDHAALGQANAEIASLKAQLEAASAPKGRASKKADPEVVTA